MDHRRGLRKRVRIGSVIYGTDQFKALQDARSQDRAYNSVPAVVIAFLAGFSERLLERVETTMSVESQSPKK